MLVHYEFATRENFWNSHMITLSTYKKNLAGITLRLWIGVDYNLHVMTSSGTVQGQLHTWYMYSEHFIHTGVLGLQSPTDCHWSHNRLQTCIPALAGLAPELRMSITSRQSLLTVHFTPYAATVDNVEEQCLIILLLWVLQITGHTHKAKRNTPGKEICITIAIQKMCTVYLRGRIANS